MPTIDVAMARSLRGGAWGSVRNALARSITANLVRRGFVDDAQGKANDVATAFSSWDNCMNAAYCKWPVIGIMVIGGLIIFSIIWCIIRCCCCGVSCCCGCCQCLKCCGDCCGACDPPGTRNKHKHLDDPYPPQPNHGYRSEAPMNASASPFAPRVNHNDFNNSAGHHTGVTQPSVPQYAEFETSKKGGGEDSLPEMPSWENAATKKVMVHEEEVEMKNLRKSPAPEQQMGAMNNTPSARSSPAPQGRNPYGPPPGRQSPYLGATQQPDPYSPIDQNYGYRSNTPVNAYGMHQSYANNSPSSPRDVTGNAYGSNHSYANNSPSSPRGVTGNGYGANSSYANNSHSSAELPATGYGVNQSYANNSSYTAGDATVNGYGTNQAYGNNNVGGTGGATMSSERDAPVELQGSDSFGPVTTNTYGQSNGNSGQTTYAEAPGDPVYPQSRTPFNDNSNYDGYRRATPGPVYGTDPNMRQSPAPHQDPYGYGQSSRRTPGPPNDYAYNQARRTPGPGNDIDRFFSPAPDRQYGAASPRPLDRPVPHRVYNDEHSQSPITNNSGFDFNSGHSRPDQSPTTTSPYPGYKAYQPA